MEVGGTEPGELEQSESLSKRRKATSKIKAVATRMRRKTMSSLVHIEEEELTSSRNDLSLFLSASAIFNSIGLMLMLMFIPHPQIIISQTGP
ncbi:unnamed protein product [Camellia sinensis]